VLDNVIPPLERMAGKWEESQLQLHVLAISAGLFLPGSLTQQILSDINGIQIK